MLKNIGKKIRQYREESGMSQKKLGIALGLSDKAVSAYESGRTLPPLETLFRISQELNIPLKFFLSEDSEELTFDERLTKLESDVSSILSQIGEMRSSIKK